MGDQTTEISRISSRIQDKANTTPKKNMKMMILGNSTLDNLLSIGKSSKDKQGIDYTHSNSNQMKRHNFDHRDA